MALVRVSPAALAEWNADAGATHARLRALVDDSDRTVADLGASWSGEAADRFGAAWRGWRTAVDRRLDTFAALRVLIDTAHGNYTSAIAANHRIWSAGAAPASSIPAAMHVETEDVRATVATLGPASERLTGSWTTLADGLRGTEGMAGDALDIAAGYAASSAAVWAAWRSAAILLLSIAGGLAETGNNVLDAEHASTPDAAPPERIAEPSVAVPAPPAPPPVAGAPPPAGPLAPYWPTADVDRLRRAAAVWQAAASAPPDAGAAGIAAVSALAAANPDRAIGLADAFTRGALSDDPTTGLVAVLGLRCRAVAGACDALADATVTTRAAIRDAVVDLLVPHEWYDVVAVVLDAVITRGAAELIARGGDITGFFLRLGWIADEHAARVRDIAGTISPIAAARLARLADGAPAPDVVTAETAPVTAPASAQRHALIAQALAEGKNIDPAQTLDIARTPDGRIVWLERGNGRSGLSHLLRASRIAQFESSGVPAAEIPSLPIRALTRGRFLGHLKEAEVYEVEVNGRMQDVVVVVGANGYIVSCFPLASRRKLVN